MATLFFASLKKRSEIDECLSGGYFVHIKGIKCFYCEDTGSQTKILFAIPKYSGNAVERNRCRRRLKAAFFEYYKRNIDKSGYILYIRGNARILNNMGYANLISGIDNIHAKLQRHLTERKNK